MARIVNVDDHDRYIDAPYRVEFPLGVAVDVSQEIADILLPIRWFVLEADYVPSEHEGH